MKRWLILLPLALIIPLAATTLAAQSVTITRLPDQPAIHAGGFQTTAQEPCLVGNLNAPYWVIQNSIRGEIGYKYLFYPPDTCDCPGGFQLEVIHFSLNLRDYDLPGFPFSFDVYVDLEEAVWHEPSQCWVPGPELCVSPVTTITVDTDGLYDIGVPVADACECAFMGYRYFLSVHFVAGFGDEAGGDIVFDGAGATACTSYVDEGLGWVDMYAAWGGMIQGNLSFFGEGYCCNDPIEVRDRTWGHVKALYR